MIFCSTYLVRMKLLSLQIYYHCKPCKKITSTISILTKTTLQVGLNLLKNKTISYSKYIAINPHRQINKLSVQTIYTIYNVNTV